LNRDQKRPPTTAAMPSEHDAPSENERKRDERAYRESGLAVQQMNAGRDDRSDDDAEREGTQREVGMRRSHETHRGCDADKRCCDVRNGELRRVR
jgi:hypothetical protein